MRKIITHYDPKPMPNRDFDWCATFEGYEPGDPIGYARGHQLCIQALLEAASDTSMEAA